MVRKMIDPENEPIPEPEPNQEPWWNINSSDEMKTKALAELKLPKLEKEQLEKN